MAIADNVPEEPQHDDTTEIGSAPEPLTVHVPEEVVTRLRPSDRSSYAGFKWVAGLLGFAAAMFFLAVFLGAVSTVLSALGYRLATGTLTEIVTSSGMRAAALGTLVAIVLAYLIGGYTAGRLARYDGGRNGLGVVLWTLIVAAAVTIAAVVLQITGTGVSQFVPIHVGLTVTATHIAAGVIAAVVALVLMVVAGLAGGLLGTRYHRRLDRSVGVID